MPTSPMTGLPPQMWTITNLDDGVDDSGEQRTSPTIQIQNLIEPEDTDTNTVLDRQIQTDTDSYKDTDIDKEKDGESNRQIQTQRDRVCLGFTIRIAERINNNGNKP
eukprot:840192-Prorocentrum_minimum.AAC.2